MSSKKILKEKTNEFLSLFWDKQTFSEKKPEWSKNWIFDGELPNNNEKGCYAHLDESGEVVYVGLAVGNSFDGSGIGSRVSKY